MTSTKTLIANVPGLSALAYRAGTHGTFKASMLAALSKQTALRGLTTRRDDDPSIALLDAWASVLDVLTFYQERIANEGFLRTATERDSLLHMGRALGYQLNPGVAASSYLAFTLDETPGAPSSVALAVGTKVQSIPAQDELPQLFETVEAIEARAEWNVLRARTAQTGIPDAGDTLFLQGTATQLKLGDALLVVGSTRDPAGPHWDFRLVKAVKPVYPALPTLDPNAGYTEVKLHQPLSKDPPKKEPKIYALRQRAALFGHNAPDWRVMSDDVRKSYKPDYSEGDIQWPGFNLAYQPIVIRLPGPGPDLPGPDLPGPDLPGPDLPDPDLPELPVVDHLYLDAIYPKVREGGWLVLATPDDQQVYPITEVSDAAMADFALTAKTTRVRVDDESQSLSRRFLFHLRDSVVFVESEELTPAGRPLSAPITGASVVLDRVVNGLVAGQRIAVTGSDANGVPQREVLTLALARTGADGLTELVFSTPMKYALTRSTVSLNANVALATHGESKTEILGGGDAAKAFQRFALAQLPLTFVSAPTPSGRASTLEVRVNQLLWQEVDSLLGRGPNERVYVTRVTDDGTAVIQFGDGINGARLPTGQDNVVATYRVGSGVSGHLAPEQLSLLMTRPLGLNGVSNPLPPDGAEDPESVDDARRNVPTTVLALERIVSLQDYTDFARAFAGVAKAQATLLWSGEQRIVHLTVAGAGGTPIEAGSALPGNLHAAIDAARHADRPVQIASYGALTFELEAKLLVREEYLLEAVMTAVQSALLDHFSFDRRDFGQPVTKSAVLAVIQSVDGVLAVDLDALYLSGDSRTLASTLPARPAAWENAAIRPAELITLEASGVTLLEMA